MGWLRGSANLDVALEAIRSGKIKKQDSVAFYVSAAANPEGRDFMLRHLAYAVRELQRIFTDTGTPSRTLETLTPLLGIGREKEILDLVETLRSPDLETGIRKGTELLRIYSRFVKANNL